MDRQWTSKVLGVVGLVALCVLMLVPTFADSGGEDAEARPLPEWFTDLFSSKLILGLDLQGGIHLQYEIDIDEALSRRASQVAGHVETLLKEQHEISCTATPGTGATLDEVTTIEVTCPTAEDAEKIDSTFIGRNVANYEIASVDDQVVTLVMSDDAITQFRTESLEQAIQTIERRINEFGVAESTITRRGETEIVVQLPGIKESDFAQAKEKLAQTGQLHFQIVDRAGRTDWFKKVAERTPKADVWPAELDSSLKSHHVVHDGSGIRSTSRLVLEYMVKDQIDNEHVIGFEEIFVDPKDEALGPIDTLSVEQEKMLRRLDATDAASSIVKGYRLHYLLRKEGMSGENVTDASVGFDRFNKPLVHMTFDRSDADEFLEMTKKFTNELMAIMIDEIVYSAPVIREPIPGGRVQIELGSAGNQAIKEASALVAVLKSGALQAPLRKLYDAQVGPTLGADSVRGGQLAVMVGFLLVVIFMAFYYRGAGLVADVALIMNVLLVGACLTAFGATLTLPGIAGVVLTVGMAVDANVLIFERIREELRMGRQVRQAIDAGYEKALSAIIDANITTVIAAVVLYQYGSGPVRGFAVTLGIGVLCSVFTALVVTRLIFDYQYGRGTAPARMSI